MNRYGLFVTSCSNLIKPFDQNGAGMWYNAVATHEESARQNGESTARRRTGV
jgi:hypothetical protein